jgi:hypothetical protein
MNARLILAIIAIAMIATGSAMLVYGQEIDVEITTESDAVAVVETHTIDTPESDTIAFWIQSGHSDLAITIDDSAATATSSNNVYYVNISEFEITSESIIEAKYSLAENTEEFEKNLQYDTNSLTISFDGNEIYSGSDLASGSTLNIALQKQTPGQTVTVENIPIWVYIIIAVLVILLIVALMRPSKKQKSTTKKESIGISEELLTAKKAMLMEILKEIEKRHRSGQISDDTYHKLKGEFKQEAVETMKQLDDIK